MRRRRTMMPTGPVRRHTLALHTIDRGVASCTVDSWANMRSFSDRPPPLDEDVGTVPDDHDRDRDAVTTDIELPRLTVDRDWLRFTGGKVGPRMGLRSRRSG